MTRARALALGLTLLAACAGGSKGAAPSPPSSSAATTPRPSATLASTVPPSTAACTTSRILSTWSLARLAAQTIVVPVAEADVGAVRAEVASGAGGVILFGSAAPPDLARAIADLERAAPAGFPPLVMTDEEGGAVQRMANLLGALPSARAMGTALTPSQIEQSATALARRLRAVGVTMDLAPVLDVDGGPGPNDRNPDGTRSFSADERVASADGLAFAAGLAAGASSRSPSTSRGSAARPGTPTSSPRPHRRGAWCRRSVSCRSRTRSARASRRSWSPTRRCRD